MIAVKVCTWCDEEKPLTEFPEDSRRRDGHRNECRDCKRSYNTQKKRGYYTPERQRDTRLRWQYGISLADFDAMVEHQDGKCLICGREFSVNVAALKPVVDHDHETGQVRGILCGNCNLAIGHLGDSADRCLAAAAYLRGLIA